MGVPFTTSWGPGACTQVKSNVSILVDPRKKMFAFPVSSHRHGLIPMVLLHMPCQAQPGHIAIGHEMLARTTYK